MDNKLFLNIYILNYFVFPQHLEKKNFLYNKTQYIFKNLSPLENI